MAWNSLNVMLYSVPAGDNYYVLFLDSTYDNMYTIPEWFSILVAGSTPTASAVSTPLPSFSAVTLQPNLQKHVYYMLCKNELFELIEKCLKYWLVKVCLFS